MKTEAAKYFYTTANGRNGPVGVEELRALAGTLVWITFALGVRETALGQSAVITSISQNGALVCSNLIPGTIASVEWASTPAGPWRTNWDELSAVVVDSNRMVSVSVPMCFRVRGTVKPANSVLIPAGSFTMGNTLPQDSNEEVPLHSVNLSAFYMDRYEVTKEVWDQVYQWATNHGYSFDSEGSSVLGVSYSKGPNHPVTFIMWYDALKWCNARSEREMRTPAYYTSANQTVVYRAGQASLSNSCVKWNAGYRLPTEAEWEKAARGGPSGHRFPWKTIPAYSFDEYIRHTSANYYSGNYRSYNMSSTSGYHPTFNDGLRPFTSPVGYFAPNDFGLYDMAGNVDEWCWDWEEPYSSETQTNPRGATSGLYRVFRGGSWARNEWYCRIAARNRNAETAWGDSLGFRCVLPAS